jgi:shikimate kinase
MKILFLSEYYMNIIEAYIKIKKQLIILVSGLSGTGKSELGKIISENLNIEGIDINKYCKKDFSNIVEVSDSIKINDWDDINSYEWDDFNKKVYDTKSKGIVCVGQYFVTEKLEFKPDFHIHIKISKNKLTENRKKYIADNPEKCKELANISDTPMFATMINKIVFKHYYEYLAKSKIDLWLDVEKYSMDEMEKTVFEYIFENVQNFLYKSDTEKKTYNSTSQIESNRLSKSDNQSDNLNQLEQINLNNKEIEDDSDSSLTPDSDSPDEPIYLGTEEKVEIVY